MIRTFVAKFWLSSLIKLKINPHNKAAYITMSNPSKRNNLSTTAMNEIYQALNEVEESVRQKETKVEQHSYLDSNFKWGRACL